MVLDIDETFDEVHGGQQMNLFNTYYGGYGYQPILVFDVAGRLVSSVLRPAGRPSGKEAACHIRQLMRSIRRHWPKTKIMLRADGHYSTPEVMDLCDTLGGRLCVRTAYKSACAQTCQNSGGRHKETLRSTLCWHGKKLRQFDTCYFGARSWDRERRVIAHIEVGLKGPDTRFIVSEQLRFSIHFRKCAK